MKKPFRFSFVFTLVMTTSILGSMWPNHAFAETDESAPLVASAIDSCQAVAFGEQRQPKASAVNVKLTVNYGATAECAPGAELTNLAVQAYRFNNTSWVGVYSRAFCTPLVTTGTSSSISCETSTNDDLSPLQANQMYKSVAIATFTILTPAGQQISQTATHSFHFFVYPDHVPNNSYDPVDGCKTTEWGTLIPSPRSVQFVSTGTCLPTAEVFDVTSRLFRYDSSGWVEIASSIADPEICQKQVSVTGGGEVRCDRPGTTTSLPAARLYRVLSGVVYRINAQGIYVNTSNGNNYYFWAYA